MIRLSAIVVRLHPSHAPALDGVDLHVARGELLVVVGPNGSGKSTLARVLVGLVAADSGSVTRDPGVHTGLVLQDPAAQLVAATVEQDVALGPAARGHARSSVTSRTAAVLHRLGLRNFATRDPRSLSGGHQQRVAIAGVLACDADLLVLDEPATHLDAPGRELVVASVLAAHRAGTTVVWVTQDPEEVALASRIVALDHGRVAWSGTSAQLVADPGLTASLGVGLPAAARLARDSEAFGLTWPGGLPLTPDALVAQLDAHPTRPGAGSGPAT